MTQYSWNCRSEYWNTIKWMKNCIFSFFRSIWTVLKSSLMISKFFVKRAWNWFCIIASVSSQKCMLYLLHRMTLNKNNFKWCARDDMLADDYVCSSSYCASLYLSTNSVANFVGLKTFVRLFYHLISSSAGLALTQNLTLILAAETCAIICQTATIR